MTAGVVPVGVLPSGALQLPADPARVGWWAAGAQPGQGQGTLVLAGHMDGAQRTGAMRALLEVGHGDHVDVADGAGTVHTYRVTARTVAPRTAVDQSLFTREGPHRLVLITCGGAFDPQVGAYEENIIVVAEPTDGTPG